MMTENETQLLDLLREETARHCRFRRDVREMLAAIIRSQGGTLRVTKADLEGGRPDEYITMTNDLETGDVAYRLQTPSVNRSDTRPKEGEHA